MTLSTLVGRTLPLKKAGNEFKACCPFHNEKTPSFWVNDLKGFFHCFGCSAHGDAIRWLTDQRGLSFIDAVKQLADEVGMELPKPDPKEAERQERAANQHELLDAVATYFSDNLASDKGATARSYLKKRNVAVGSLDEFRLGFASDGRANLSQALTGYSQEQLIDAGLLISVGDKAPYDRFRNRLMVPIRDPRGRVIAFGGRILGDGEPKYLNSPDTALFDKGRVLFNLDQAGPASRQAGRILVVEGYFDVIALSEVGIRETVAPMGTALTEAQMEQLWRLVDEPILCFDGDAAGRKAAERACVRAMQNLRPGKQLRVVLIPAGQDPDEIVRASGRERFESVIETAQPLARFLYDTELRRIDVARPEQRANMRKTLDDLARTCSDRFMADEFARSFKELFFEDFGWKTKDRKEIVRSSVRTSKRVAPDLYRLFIRSALHGLTRFPAVAAANIEDVVSIRISHPDLRRWRDAIANAVMSKPDLHDDGFRQIVEVDVLPETIQRDMTYDLRFGFAVKGTQQQRAEKQLEKLVQFLSHEQSIATELDDHDRKAILADSEEEYAAVENARQRIREARIAMIEAGTDWDVSLQ